MSFDSRENQSAPNAIEILADSMWMCLSATSNNKCSVFINGFCRQRIVSHYVNRKLKHHFEKVIFS